MKKPGNTLWERKLTKREKVQIGLIVGVLFFVFLFLLFQKEKPEKVFINRPGIGTESLRLSLSDETSSEDITLEVRERKQSREDIAKLLWETVQCLHTKFAEVKRNESLESFVKEAQKSAGPGVRIFFESSEESVLSKEGKLFRENVEEPAAVELIARILYEDEWQEEHFKVFVDPFEKGSFQERAAMTRKELQELEEGTLEETGFLLPQEENGIKIIKQKEKNTDFRLILAGLLFLPVFYQLLKRQEKQKKQREREQEFQAFYPQMITKLTLLTGAGLSVTNAFLRMAEGYRARVGAENKEPYREVMQLAMELKNGTSEERALRQFGERIDLASYRRCTALLISQMHSGAGGLKDKLFLEVSYAFEQRRKQVEEKGEEAQTKLLIPMMGMLLLVLLAVMIPAFLSMGV